jgi:hypothetical protein
MCLWAPRATSIATPPWGAALRAQGDPALSAPCDPHVTGSVRAMIGQSSFQSGCFVCEERHTVAYGFTTCCCPTPPPPSLFQLSRTHTHGDPFEGRLRNPCAIGAPGLQSRKDFGAPLEGGSEILERLEPRDSNRAMISEPPGRGLRNLCTIGALGLQSCKDFGAPLFRSACVALDAAKHG